MVDVVELLGGVTVVQCEQVPQRADDVLLRQNLLLRIDIKLELLVDLVTADAREVVALVVEVQAVQQLHRGVDGGRLARALATVDLEKCILASRGNVTLQRGANHVGVAKQVHDLVVALGDAERAEQQGCALAALAVDGDHQVAVLVDLELKPRTTRRDELHVLHGHAVVELLGEVHARGADQLRDDDALGTVDDERTAVSHQGEVAHEDELLLDLARVGVHEAHVDEERRLVRHVLGTALGNVRGRVAKLVFTKGDLHVLRRVLDGRKLGEALGQAFGHEAVERLLLYGNEVGQLHRTRDLAEAHALALLLCGLGRLCGRHQALPPSTR